MISPSTRTLLFRLLGVAGIGTACIGEIPGSPPGFSTTQFAGPDLTPSPACLCASPGGDIYVGVDMLGSLGKGAGKGRIVKLTDTNNDGKADQHTVYAEIDNPRGLIALGHQLYVLHTVIPESTGVMTGMHLSVLTDGDGDGVADSGPKPLVKNISTLKSNQNRGADHTTNGIRMGIDGWIYIAVGDFGMVDAEGTDGKKLTMLGGGVVRVRPDGSELEVYTRGLRNIYDVAIDPFMNIFTRGNTNDGGGWNVRFSHQIQSGEYGYPTLFKHFTGEIIPALEDLGGGSGTGALFLQEPSWPEKYNNVPMMADWGRNQLYIHRLTPDGASFHQTPENFLRVSQITDVDVDGSGRMYLSAWDGAGYKGNSRRGYIERVVPEGWTYTPFPGLAKLPLAALVKALASPSATARLHVSQEILRRGDRTSAAPVLALAKDKRAAPAARVAAIFTYSQLLGADATSGLLALVPDPAVTEFALRAMADRLAVAKKLSTEPFTAGLRSENPRVRVAAAVALGRIGKKEAAGALLAVARPPAPMPPSTRKGHQGGPHATPNSAVALPHTAVRALVRMRAVDACLNALDGPSRDGALWALRLMHDARAVDGLIAKLHSTTDSDLQLGILTALARLYTKEEQYDGSWWWGTRPDTRGPYYVPALWAQSPKIENAYRAAHAKAPAEAKQILADIATKHRMNLSGIGKMEKAKRKSGQKVGNTSIEDVMLAFEKNKYNPANGKRVFAGMAACGACHNLKPGDPIKGPDLLRLGSHLTRAQIAEAILKPEATIAESWVDVTMADGSKHTGTLVTKSDQEIVLHNIAGVASKLKASEVKKIAKADSTLMAPHLADHLTVREFTDLVNYLHSLK